jgi:integrase
MPHRPKGSLWWKTRITLADGTTGIFACGTTSEDVAKDVERMVKTFEHDRVWAPLTLVVLKKAKLGDVYDSMKAGALGAFLSARESVDLAPLVSEWPAGLKYKTQVRCLIPEDSVFPATAFTKKKVSEFLAGLTCSGSTKNRYRAALSVFAKWLLERDIIPHNIVRDVGSFKPNPARPVWLDRVQAKALINALPMPYRAIEALMAATGVEWQVVERLTRRDVDLHSRTLHARGGKTPWRNRVVRGTELWAWRIFADYAKQFTDNAQVFSVSKFRALEVHLEAAEVLNLPRTTLHDWRHTYAVGALRDGYSIQVVAHQLGHRDTVLVQSRYGRFVPEASDYRHFRKPLSSRARPSQKGRLRSRSA